MAAEIVRLSLSWGVIVQWDSLPVWGLALGEILRIVGVFFCIKGSAILLRAAPSVRRLAPEPARCTHLLSFIAPVPTMLLPVIAGQYLTSTNARLTLAAAVVVQFALMLSFLLLVRTIAGDSGFTSVAKFTPIAVVGELEILGIGIMTSFRSAPMAPGWEEIAAGICRIAIRGVEIGFAYALLLKLRDTLNSGDTGSTELNRNDAVAKPG